MSKTFETPVFAAVCVAFVGMAATANATFLTPGFSGNTEYEGWSGLTAANNPGYPGFSNSTALWPAPIDPNETGSAGNADFDKVSGGGYPAGGSIYNSFFPGTYRVDNSSPLTNVKNVLFQIELGAGVNNFGTPQQTTSFFDDVAGSEPVLNYNGGTQALAADYDTSFAGPTAFTVPIPGVPGGTTTIFALQWDLSGLGSITSYEIVWTGVEFGTTYALQLDSSDVFTSIAPPPAPIPSPGSMALIGLTGFAAARRRRSS